MKKLLLILLINLSISAKGQSTWFKVLNGWTSLDSKIMNDTIYTFGTGDNSFLNYMVIINKTSLNGFSYKSDSFNSPVSNSVSYPRKDCVLAQGKDSLLFSLTNIEDTIFRTWLYTYPGFQKKPIDINIDSTSTLINQILRVNGNTFFILSQAIYFSPSFTLLTFHLGKLVNDSIVIIKSVRNTPNFDYGNDIDKLLGDNQSVGKLFYTKTHYSDNNASFQTDLVKIDTNGKVQWVSRPNLDWENTNTTYMQMLQKPNGNFLCCWTDLYYRPYKMPGSPYQNADVKFGASLWMAEIDYQTGKVLWNKSMRNFFSQYLPPTLDGTQFFLLADAKMLADSSMAWVGRRLKDNSGGKTYKTQPFLLKTDYNGNPLWYRETDLNPGDSGERGMSPFSFITAPDNGYLLTGEYMNMGGEYSNGEFWQKAAVLKLDSNACLLPDCYKKGCTNTLAYNYNPQATEDDGTCVLPKCGPNQWQLEFYNSATLEGDKHINITITGMEDNKVYYQKNTRQIADTYTMHPSPLYMGKLDTTYAIFYDLVCLPFTGQCYKVTYNDEKNRNNIGNKVHMPISLIMNRTEYNYGLIQYQRLKSDGNDRELYIKDGKFTDTACVFGDSIPPKPPKPDTLITPCQITLYPNPNNGTFSLACSSSFTLPLAANIKLYSSIGAEVYNAAMNQLPFNIKTQGLSPGIYLLKLMDANHQVTQTFKVNIIP